MCPAPPVPPPPSPQAGAAARGVPIPWRSVRVLRAGREVQANARLRILRHLREHGHLPDGYVLEPTKGWAIDFMGFDEQGE